MARANTDDNWRLEIVANLTAARAGEGRPQRLTLTADDVRARAQPWRFRVDLGGLGEHVRGGAGPLELQRAAAELIRTAT